jgi:hypothetical protein
MGNPLNVDPEYLRAHYASLSDRALLDVSRSDLVEIAQQCYDSEMKRRGLVQPWQVRRAVDSNAPTSSPGDPANSPETTIDRVARDLAAQAIRSYMDEEIASTEFAETLDEVSSRTSEEGIRAVCRQLWYFYDDCKDHPVVASKQNWDYFNRVLLLLASGAEIRVETRRRALQIHQAAAGVALAVSVCLAALSGFTPETIAILALPTWLVSVALSWLNNRVSPADRRHAAIHPFPSAGSLLGVRRAMKSFPRRRYPAGMAARRIRGPVSNAILWLPSILLWMIFSPIVLLIQAIPGTEERFVILDSSLPKAA